jgi:hypothetical protein
VSSTHPSLDEAGGQRRGVLGRSALVVDRYGRHGDGQSGGEPGGPRHVEPLLADLADAASDDLACQRRIDARALEHRLLDDCQQIRRVHARQPATPPTDGSPDCFHHHDISHAGETS